MSDQSCPPLEALLPMLDAAPPATADAGEQDMDPALARHVRGCPRCQSRLEQMRSRRTTMRGLLPRVGQAGAAAAATSHPALIGKYLIAGVLRQCPSYTVYRAAHAVLRENVAIQLAAEPVMLDSARNMMIGEARVLARITHRNIAKVIDFDFLDDRPYVVTQYVRGPAINEADELGAHTVRRSVAWIVAVAQALAAVHSAGMAHLDIQPRHIRVDEQNQPMLLLLGSSLLQRVRDGAIPAGDPAYLSPEQASKTPDEVGHASDVFSLAAVLYFLLTGQPPFTGPEAQPTIGKAQASDIDLTTLHRQNLPSGLRDAVTRALGRRPTDRPSASAMAQLLCPFSRPRGLLSRLFHR
jgi:serine/threonine-protein kinase